MCPECKQAILTCKIAPREYEIIKLVAEGLRNKDIAYKVHLTEATVKEYLFRVFRKVDVSTRTELAMKFHKGLINCPPGKTVTETGIKS